MISAVLSVFRNISRLRAGMAIRWKCSMEWFVSSISGAGRASAWLWRRRAIAPKKGRHHRRSRNRCFNRPRRPHAPTATKPRSTPVSNIRGWLGSDEIDRLGHIDGTGDFMQGDEDKWGKINLVSAKAIFIDAVDADGGVNVLQASLTVARPNDAPLVAVTAGINVDALK